MKFNIRELDLIEMSIREWLISIRKDHSLNKELKAKYITDLEALKSKITNVEDIFVPYCFQIRNLDMNPCIALRMTLLVLAYIKYTL